MVNNPYQKYKQQSIMTASSGDLTLMLYDGFIKQVNLAILYIDENDFQMKNKSIQKACAILSELMSTLDMSYDISHSMFQLYEYMYRLLILSGVTNNKDNLNEVNERMQEIRDTWEEAIKIDRKVAFHNAGEI